MAWKYRISGGVLLSLFLIGGTVYTILGFPIKETNAFLLDRPENTILEDDIIELVENTKEEEQLEDLEEDIEDLDLDFEDVTEETPTLDIRTLEEPEPEEKEEQIIVEEPIIKEESAPILQEEPVPEKPKEEPVVIEPKSEPVVEDTKPKEEVIALETKEEIVTQPKEVPNPKIVLPKQPIEVEKPKKDTKSEIISDGDVSPQTVAENNKRLHRESPYRSGTLGKQWEGSLLDPSNLAWWKEREVNMRNNPDPIGYESLKFQEVYKQIKDNDESDGRLLMELCKESYDTNYVAGTWNDTPLVRDVWTWCLKPTK